MTEDTPANVIANVQAWHMAELAMRGRARRLDEWIIEALDEAGYEIVRKQ